MAWSNWVYAAIDVDRNEVLSMRVFPSRNVLATKLFIEEVLKVLRRDAYLRRRQRSMADRSTQGAGPKIQRGVLSEIGA
jgi:transposase-like protein